MVRVLLDATVDGADGIGRYTRCVVEELRRAPPADLDVVLTRPGSLTNQYSQTAGHELLSRAVNTRADLAHLMDYRVPVTAAPTLPMIVTVHDVMRVRNPDLCYSDTELAARSGEQGLVELRDALTRIRELAAFPVDRCPVSRHEEYLGRMLVLAVARAERVITPTATVARALCGLVPPAGEKIVVSSWGVDHLAVAPGAGSPNVPARYLLYVGQARPHKGLPAVLTALATHRGGMPLVLAGRDLTPDSSAVDGAVRVLGTDRVVALGEVPDAVLARLYTDAAALIHLADQEGFGFPPLEALAYGCPVVASDIPVLRETLGPHASFVDSADPEHVMTGVQRLIATNTPALRAERIAWAGRLRWSRHVEDLLTCYRRADTRC